VAHPLDDTIVAVASASGGAARGIVRLSGPRAVACLEGVFRPSRPVDLQTLGAARAVPGALLLDATADRRLACEAYIWPGRRSFTGQPAAEIHALGSPPLLEAVVRLCCEAGARLAQPGEFTMRAFLAGRIDLTQAEAVLGVIQADDDRSLDVALAQLAGGLAAPLLQLRNLLLDLLAQLEAGFDFADEDLPFLAPGELENELASATQLLRRMVERLGSRDVVAPRVRVVLAGRPSVGKTRLFNALSGADALVSPQPGTTRDYLTAEIDLDGVRCLLIDTAGIDQRRRRRRGSENASIDAAAQELAAEQHREAQVRLLCLDASQPLDDWERRQLARRSEWLPVLTKIDAPRRVEPVVAAVQTSARTGEGLGALLAVLREAVVAAQGAPGDVVPATAARCRESLRLAGECLAQASELAATDRGDKLFAADLRVALDELGKVAGVVYTEDILDRIFSRFCVGK
jgi:tRNA modification GTPase